MKKLLLSVLATVGIAVILPVSAFADSGVTDVSGVVTSNGTEVGGASVTVSCNGNSGSDTTDGTGTYLVQFTAAQCPKGDTVTATATKGGMKGTASGPAGFITNKLNIAIINVSIVPELGTVTAAGAAVLGGAAFLTIRRRHLGQN